MYRVQVLPVEDEISKRRPLAAAVLKARGRAGRPGTHASSTVAAAAASVASGMTGGLARGGGGGGVGEGGMARGNTVVAGASALVPQVREWLLVGGFDVTHVCSNADIDQLLKSGVSQLRRSSGIPIVDSFKHDEVNSREGQILDDD